VKNVDGRIDAVPTTRHIWFVAALAAFLCAVILVSAWLVFPPTAGDDAAWLVTAVNQRAGRGPVNMFYGEGAMVWYPLLYVFLLSAAMTAPTYSAAVLAAALMKAISLALLAWAWTRLAARGGGGRGTLACIAGGLCTQFMLLYTNYRPEVGVVLVLSVFVLLVSFGIRGAAVWGVALGLVAGANPMCGLVFSGMAVMFFARDRDASGTMRAVLATGAISVLVFLGVLAAGWGIRDTLRTTAEASRGQIYASLDAIRSIRYLFGQKQAFFGGLPGSIGLIALGAYPFTRRVHCRPLYWMGFAWLIGTILEASVLRTERVYNVFAFLSLVVAFFVLQGQSSPRWQAAGAASLSLAALGSVVALTAFGLHLFAGVRYEEARVAWQDLRVSWPVGTIGRVAATTSLWGLAGGSEELARFRILNSGRGWDTGELGGSPILIQQMFGSDLLPDRTSPPRTLRIPALGIDHVLAVDLFNRKIPRVFGVLLGRSVPGWGFAAYLPRRVGSHPQDSIGLAPNEPSGHVKPDRRCDMAYGGHPGRTEWIMGTGTADELGR
jgi:hypothetical protein